MYILFFMAFLTQNNVTLRRVAGVIIQLEAMLNLLKKNPTTAHWSPTYQKSVTKLLLSCQPIGCLFIFLLSDWSIFENPDV